MIDSRVQMDEWIEKLNQAADLARLAPRLLDPKTY
jgi:hypothetical protein